MHELSIAINIVDIASDEARKAKKDFFSEIEIEIGSMSGIVHEALEFAMTEAIKNTCLERAKLTYTIISAEANCEKCCNKFEVDDFFAVCPKCGSFKTNVTKGKDLTIKKLILA
jgi:hydrogenase nickel incorporation protein HypA/HybF